jgi:uncharacterized iron-regulated membrane protein
MRERVASAYPGAAVNYVELHGRPQDSMVFYLEPKREGYPALSVDQVFVDPYSGEILGARRWGAILEGWHNLMPFIYPVMSRLFEMQTRIDQLPSRDIDHGKALMSWDEALRTGQTLMDDLARNEGFMVISAEALQFRPDQAVYRYKVRSSLDIRDLSGNTDVVFDARNGTLLTSYLPTGKASGDTITTWITTLHMGFIWGIPFRVFLTILGIATAMLSVTGVYIWWKKRKGRQASLIRKRTYAYASTVSEPAGPAREG